MRLDCIELTAFCFKDGGSYIHRIPSVADQRAFVTTDVAKVEEVARSGGGMVHIEPRKIVESDVIIGDDDKD